MDHHREFTGSGREYASAHATHYSERNLPAALQLYRELMASRPNAPEAQYSRTQIQNIIEAVVPARELLDAEIELALAQFARRD
jgi:hypothetical protein